MGERVFAVVGLYASPGALLDAILKVRPKDLGRLEAYTPYPVHGVEEALGLRRSPLAGMVLVMGVLGTATAFLFQWWMNAVDYPIVVGGKPLASWQAFVPIMFEVTVLFASFTAWLGCVFLLCRLPELWHPMLSSRSAARITRDLFALSIESRGAVKAGGRASPAALGEDVASGGAVKAGGRASPAALGEDVASGGAVKAGGRDFDADGAEKALKEAGALETEVIPFLPAPRTVSLTFLLGLSGAGFLLCLFGGLALYWTIKLFPLFPPMSRMLSQNRLNAQTSSAVFAATGGLAPVPEGSVARGRLPYPFKTPEEAEVLANPLPRTKAVLDLGRAKFNTVCKVCHGPLADGAGTLTKAYGASPANLQSARYLRFPDGSVFHTITNGRNAMPSFARALTEDERWAVVHYLRVLQRARNAKDSDLP